MSPLNITKTDGSASFQAPKNDVWDFKTHPKKEGGGTKKSKLCYGISLNNESVGFITSASPLLSSGILSAEKFEVMRVNL